MAALQGQVKARRGTVGPFLARHPGTYAAVQQATMEAEVVP
jgi:hypothetical protein